MLHKLNWRVVIAFMLAVVIVWFGIALQQVNRHADQRHTLAVKNNANISKQIANDSKELDAMHAQLSQLIGANTDLSHQASAAQAQANTSVSQLTKSGQTPIISSPGVVTVSTTPSTTTTMPPVVVTVPVPSDTTTTTEPPPDTTTTTTEPPDTTTTTTPPDTTTIPPDTTTTTTPPDTTTTTAGQ